MDVKTQRKVAVVAVVAAFVFLGSMIVVRVVPEDSNDSGVPMQCNTELNVYPDYDLYMAVPITYDTQYRITYPGATWNIPSVTESVVAFASRMNTTVDEMYCSGMPKILRINTVDAGGNDGVSFAFNVNTTWFIIRPPISNYGEYHTEQVYLAISNIYGVL